MAYTVNLLLLDAGGWYAAGIPAFSGSLFAPPPPGSGGTPVDAALTTTAAPTVLTFASAASPPARESAMLVTDTSTGGDLFRSGPMSVLPPSPGTVTVATAPTVSLAGTALAAGAATFAGPIPIPWWLSWVIARVSGNTLVPVSVTVAGATLTLTPPTLTVDVTGTIVMRQFYFWIVTHPFSLTFTITPGPSGDPTDPANVLSLPPAGATMVIANVAKFISDQIASVLIGYARSRLEAFVNGLIASRAASALTSRGLRASPTSVICARRVTVLASGVAAQVCVSDLRGPAVTPIGRTLALAITPVPRAGVAQTYTVTVTDAVVSTLQVPTATVTLHNYTAGASAVVTTVTTDVAGRANFTAALTPRVVQSVAAGGRGDPLHERERVFLSPVLTVGASGYSVVTMTLLDDPKVG